tara:strand:+ start:54 stop:284 length:231 start_codon:yes stop_codon:yes gene_type:complete
MFVTDKKIAEIADDLQSAFEVGSLHSHSSINAIAAHASVELSDNGLPTRQSLCLVVAKVALATWIETMIQTKATLA